MWLGALCVCVSATSCAKYKPSLIGRFCKASAVALAVSDGYMPKDRLDMAYPETGNDTSIFNIDGQFIVAEFPHRGKVKQLFIKRPYDSIHDNGV